jgi:mono/diheme cytochrome c family protein
VASSVTRIDLGPGHSAENIPLPYGSTNTRQIRISPDNLWAYVAHTRGHVNLPTNQLEKGWVNTNAISIIDLNTNHLYATVLLDNVQRGAADPWGIALSGDGKKLWVSLAGVHELGIINLEALHAYLSGAAFPDQLKPSDAKAKVAFDVWKLIESDPSQRTILQNELSALYAAGVYRRISLPIRGPRAISVSPDGQILAVAGYFSGDVLLISSSDHRIIKRIQLGAKAPASIVHRGEAVFHDARRSFQGWLSCATCHPDGRADGLNWDLLNDGIGNPKNTRSLLFSHETPPSMSTGVRARSKEAVKAGFLHIQFSEANDSELEAVNTYLRSLVPEQSPYLKGGTLSARARAGKEIFNSQETGCGSCHSDRYFTDLRSYDVGTHSRLDYRSEFDNPTLLEIWRSGPYLHSGAAANLRAVILDQNPDGRHGKTSHLTEKEIDALIEYLLSL